MKWQEFFDTTFPDGVLVEWLLQEYTEDEWDLNPVEAVKKIYVLQDEPAPLVWFYVLDANQQINPFRIVTLDKVHDKPYVAKVRTDGTTFKFSTGLTKATKERVAGITDDIPWMVQDLMSA